MDYRRMTAPCGLDCFNCTMYLADEDESLRRRISEVMEIPKDKARCSGCRNEGGTMAFLNMTEPCKVFRCIDRKGLDFCSECTDFPISRVNSSSEQAYLIRSR